MAQNDTSSTLTSADSANNWPRIAENTRATEYGKRNASAAEHLSMRQKDAAGVSR